MDNVDENDVIGGGMSTRKMHWGMWLVDILPGEMFGPMGVNLSKNSYLCDECISAVENWFPLKRVILTESTLENKNCRIIEWALILSVK